MVTFGNGPITPAISTSAVWILVDWLDELAMY